MENFKWEKPSDIELPKHDSRARPLSEEIVLESDSEGLEASTQENTEIPQPETIESSIKNDEYVTANEGVVNQANPKLISISMKDFEGAPADRNSAERKAIKELSDAREKFALADEGKDLQEYMRVSEEYELKVEKEKDFIIEHKKATLETKGLFDRKAGTYKKLTPEEVQLELDKYKKEKIIPHFAVVEAAKIQEARTEPSFIEKMKGSELGSFAGRMIDGYRKMPWQKKLLVSAGLLGAGVTAGAVGGTFGLALAGIITGGKGIQRIFSGAGTAVGIEALIQKSQQKWMSKEGWGKNRHEYVSKQIALMSEKMKSGEGADGDIKERLKEREKIEKSNEIRRVGIAAVAGVLVGSGAAFRAAKDTLLAVNDYLGVGDYWGDKFGQLFGGEVKAPTEHPVTETLTPPATEAVAPFKIEPITLTIDTRGPEGALIDEFRNNPDLAKKFGWLGEGKEDLSKWAGSKAHILWGESANQALLDPSVKQELAKLGYPETVEGYEKMMTRVGKGIVSLDVGKGSIKLDAEYLKNITTIDNLPPEVSPLQPPSSPEVFSFPPRPIIDTTMSDVSRPPFTSKDFEFDLEGIQRQMDLPAGKLRGILLNSGVASSSIEELLKEEGGVEKLLKMPVRELYGMDQGYPRDVRLDLLYDGLKRITGDARLDSNDNLEDVLKSIDSKNIFHGTAEDILKGGIPPAEVEPSYPDVTEGVGNQESPVLVDQEGISDNVHSDVVGEKVVEHAPSPDTSTNIPHEDLAKSPVVKTPGIVEGVGQIKPYEVVTKTGIKGIYSYDSNGNIVGMKVESPVNDMGNESLLNDNYREISPNVASAKRVAQALYRREQVLQALEDSGKGNSKEAEFLRKMIKDLVDSTERKHGDIFKDIIPSAETAPSHLGTAGVVETPAPVETPLSTPEISPSNEVVTTTGIKGTFEYSPDGKIVNMKVEGAGSMMQGRSLLNDNYHEVMKNKGAKLLDIRSVEVRAQNLFQQEQVLKHLEDSGQGSSDKAELLRKLIKKATDDIESKYGKIFK